MDMTNVADLDKLIQNFEYENQQYVKLIEKENQHIEALGSEIQVKKDQGEQLQREITQLDEDTKRAHKQFVHNRENGESLKKTLDVLKDHESALGQSLKSLVDKGNDIRKERSMMIEHYRGIWKDYEEKYKSFPLAQDLKAKQDTVKNLQTEVQMTEQKILNLQNQIHNFNNNNNVEFRDMVNVIIKIAKLKTDTNNIVSALKTANEKKMSIEKEIKEAEEQKKAAERAAKEELEKLNQSMEQDDRDTSDGGEASTLISMMKDDGTDDIVLETPLPMKNLTNNMAALHTQCDVSPSQKAEQMETDVVSPAQIHIEVETGRSQNSLKNSISQPAPQPKPTVQTFIRPTMPVPRSQHGTTSNIPHIPCQNFLKCSPQMQHRQVARTSAPQQVVTFSNPSMLRQVPRVSVPQVMSPSIQQFVQARNPSTQQQDRVLTSLQQTIRNNPQQFFKPSLPQVSQLGVRSAGPQITRPCVTQSSVQQIRPFGVQQVGQRTPVTQPSRPRLSQPYQAMEENRNPQVQTRIRPSARLTRLTTPSIPSLPVTDPVKKMQSTIAKPVAQITEQSPRKSQSTNKTEPPKQQQKRSPVQELSDENGNPVLSYSSSPSQQRPKTPENGIMNLGGGDYSPFDLEKHRKHLEELKQSPGQPLKERRPMFSADKLDPNKSTESGIFTGFQTIGMFDSNKSKTNNQGDGDFNGFGTELSMFQSSEKDRGETGNFFGEKITSFFGSPDVGGGDTGFNFGGDSNGNAESSGFSFGGNNSDDTGCSSIMSLFGDSSTEDQQETSFSFSFGGTSSNESPARGFSLF